MMEVRHGRLDCNEEKTVVRVEALFLVRGCCCTDKLEGVDFEEQVARKVRRFRRGTVDGVVEGVCHQRGEREGNPFTQRKDAPTSPILWEKRETCAQSLGFMGELSAARTALEGAPCGTRGGAGVAKTPAQKLSSHPHKQIRL